jgi:site-specific DNA-adenine methylase
MVADRLTKRIKNRKFSYHEAFSGGGAGAVGMPGGWKS